MDDLNDKKFDIKEKISNVSESASCGVMFTGMMVFISCAVVALVMLFCGKFLKCLIFLLIAAAAFLFTQYVIRCDDRHIKKKKNEYRQKYITAIKVTDLDLGELYFEHDSKIGELTLIHGVPALAGSGELEVTNEDGGLDTVPVREFVKRLLKDKDKIVEGMLGVVKEVYEDEGITEEEAGGNPTDRDYILSHLSIDMAYIAVNEDGSWSASVRGGMDNSVADHIGEHGLTAELSSDSPDYEFYSG